ncbi:MAG: hypothetical protein IT317_23830, partial [Anaerolineales bacterium]|nr:hypothetical protein [Anaerolineales bacterium]
MPCIEGSYTAYTGPLITIGVVTLAPAASAGVGEHVLLMLLAFAHAQAAREWAAGRTSRTLRELRGATLGILGYGSIGREAARQARA